MPGQGPRKAVRTLILLAAALLIAVASIVTAVHFSGENFVSAKLVLPNGAVVSVAGVDYGTNHVLGSRFMRWTARTPPAVQAGLKKLFGPRVVPRQTFATSTPTLVIWLDSSPPAMFPTIGSYEVLLANTNGFVSGTSQPFWLAAGSSPSLQFSAFPRRERFIGLRVFYHDAQNKLNDCGTLNIPNPEYRSDPQWKPEALPVTRQTGDVEATLEQFCTGLGQDMVFTATDGGGQAVEFKKDTWNAGNESAMRLRLRPLADTNQSWRVDHVELADATGNMLQSLGVSWGMGGGDIYGFNPGLWTDETAWKLRCEIKRTRGFGTNELLTFKNVPLPEIWRTNHMGWSTNVNGITVTLDYILRRPPFTNNSFSSGNQFSEAHFLMKGLSNNFHADLLEARADIGGKLQSFRSSWSSDGKWQEYDWDIPRDAKTVDFTFAVQQGRWVEFMVKPETGPARFEIPGTKKKKQ